MKTIFIGFMRKVKFHRAATCSLLARHPAGEKQISITYCNSLNDAKELALIFRDDDEEWPSTIDNQKYDAVAILNNGSAYKLAANGEWEQQ